MKHKKDFIRAHMAMAKAYSDYSAHGPEWGCLLCEVARKGVIKEAGRCNFCTQGRMEFRLQKNNSYACVYHSTYATLNNMSMYLFRAKYHIAMANYLRNVPNNIDLRLVQKKALELDREIYKEYDAKLEKEILIDLVSKGYKP